MACEPSGGIENCQEVHCPCLPSCEGMLEFIYPNRGSGDLDLLFLQCSVCACAWVVRIAEEGKPYLNRMRAESKDFDVYDLARYTCHRLGLSWTDPRTGVTYPPPPQ